MTDDTRPTVVAPTVKRNSRTSPFDTTIAFVVEDGRITRIRAMRNPHELGRLDELAELSR